MVLLRNFDTFDPAYFERLFEIEDRHFWFVGRNHIIATLLRALAGEADAPNTAVEIGCGTGNVLRVVKASLPRATIVGMDLFMEGLSQAQTRTTAPLVQGNVEMSPFRDGIDLVCLFDVLEHIRDDAATLRLMRTMLAPGGRVLITVPLHPSLWSEFDELSHHVRRYRPAELLLKLRQAGFVVEFGSPYLLTTLIPMWVRRKVLGNGKNARIRADDELRIVPFVNRIFLALLRVEGGWIGQRRRLPFGASMIVLARRAG
jgi:SAM-dependent methyltransferase